MNRPSSLGPGLAIAAALLGAPGCSSTPGALPPDAADSGADSATVVDAAAADCGAFPTPNAWATWVMPNPVRSGLPNPASYTISASGDLVTDNVTGLVWQRHVEAATFTWQDARQHCACLTLDGRAWRLPSRIELASLADWTAASPAIDGNAFPNTPSEDFWTSSVLNGDPGLGLIVFFENGYTSYSDKAFAFHIRCVSSPAAAPGQTTAANGTVYDPRTKLTWQQVHPDTPHTWADANATCSALSLNGTGWRIPSINELQTIVDDALNPSIDQTAFPQTPSEYFWSSSVVVGEPTRAWTAFFGNGSTYSFPMSATTGKYVRCVR